MPDETSYQIAPDGVVGAYPEFATLDEALAEAARRVASEGVQVKVVRVDGPVKGPGLDFTPLVILSPPLQSALSELVMEIQAMCMTIQDILAKAEGAS